MLYDWKEIAFIFCKNGYDKSGKQCRERWLNFLNPALDHSKLTTEEEELIFKDYAIYGKMWVKIAEDLKKRSENTIKNCFYSTMRKQKRFFTLLFQKKKFKSNI